MSCSFPVRCDLMTSSRVPSTSFIASMPFIKRFIMTCCNCTRSPRTCGRSAANSIRTDMRYRVIWLRRRTISSNNSVYINQLPLWSTLLEEQPDPADDFRRTRSVFHDSHGTLARLFEIWVGASEPIQAGIGVGNGGSNRLIHFVGQGGTQLTHRGHPADVCEIRLRLTQRFFGPLLLGQGGNQCGGQNDKRSTGNRQGQIGLIETCVCVDLSNRAVSCKSGPSHGRVVHTGNGQAHHDGGNELLPKIRGSECQP